MIARMDKYVQHTGLQVKHRKCAILHGHRNGLSWFKKSKTERLDLVVQGSLIPKYSRDQTYGYLGHLANMSRTAWDQQVNSAMEYCQDMLQRIDKSPLPIFAKCKAVNMIVMSKLQFYFSNTHFTVKSLLDLENLLVRLVREWFSLNTSATHSFMFVPKCNVGLGLRNPTTLYNSKRVSFLLSVLNSKDTLVRKVARESLALHMRARKVLKAPDGAENQFLGCVVDSEDKVVKGSKQCWGRSDWIELNELCIRIGIKAVRLVLDEDDDECTYGITITKDDTPVTYTDHKLDFRALKVKDIDKWLSDWKRVINQGRLADPAVTNKKCSNLKGGDHVHRFVIKGRLQLLETIAMKHICFPNAYPDSRCRLCNHPHDNTSHVLNGCMNFRQNYTKRHDRIVNILYEDLAKIFGYAGCKLYTNTPFNPNMLAEGQPGALDTVT